MTPIRVATAVAAVALMGATTTPFAEETQAVMQSTIQDIKPVKHGHVAIDGVNYYYEVHGKGEPLLLLHGGLGNFDMFKPVLPLLAGARQVIGVDLHGHGRTALGDRDISLVDMGRDMAGIVQHLGHETVDVLGYSMGSGVALQFAAQYPQKVRRLVLVSAAYSQDGYYPEMLPMQAQIGSGMLEMMKNTPMYQSYVSVAPDPGAFGKLLDQMGALMRKPYDFSEDVKKLTMPVMLVYGDGDMFRPEHIVKFYQLLGGGLRDAGWMRENMSRNRLAILPNLTHYEIFMSPDLVRTVLPFLNGETDTKRWAEHVPGTQ